MFRASYLFLTSTSMLTMPEPLSVPKIFASGLRHRPVVFDGVEARKGQRQMEDRVDERAREVPWLAPAVLAIGRLPMTIESDCVITSDSE